MVQLRKALERAGVPRIRLHDMRHTAATSLLTAGVHPKLVQDMLGHSTIITTMDVYSHVMPAVHGDAVLRLDQMLNDARSERGMVAGVRAPA
jgi:integrase